MPFTEKEKKGFILEMRIRKIEETISEIHNQLQKILQTTTIHKGSCDSIYALLDFCSRDPLKTFDTKFMPYRVYPNPDGTLILFSTNYIRWNGAVSFLEDSMVVVFPSGERQQIPVGEYDTILTLFQNKYAVEKRMCYIFD
jgi:hypothetical protein